MSRQDDAKPDRVFSIPTGGTVVKCMASFSDPDLKRLITAGLNDKELVAPAVTDAPLTVAPLDQHWVVKTSKARKLVAELDPDPDPVIPEGFVASADAGAGRKMTTAEKCKHMQSLYVEADFVAVLMASVGSALFPEIKMPETVLHVEPEKPEHLMIDKDGKVPPSSRILTRMMPGYSEPFPKKDIIVETLAGKNTPEVWKKYHSDRASHSCSFSLMACVTAFFCCDNSCNFCFCEA